MYRNGSEEGAAVAVLLRRALDNLLDNARKYSPDERAVVLSVERGEGGAVPIAVVDRGVGLGLVLTRRIVESHGGTVGFSSTRDEGSRFWLTLPASPV